MVWRSYHNGINFIQVPVIYFSEILVTGYFFVLLEGFAGSALIHIAKAYIFYLPGLIQAVHYSGSAATYSEGRYIEGITGRNMAFPEDKTGDN
jgi:hypothetical protein